METNAEAATAGSIPRTKSGLPLYEVVKNKDGVEFKIINFNNPDVCPNEGTIVIEAIRKKDFERQRSTNFSVSVAKDKATDIHYGIFIGFYKDGSPKFQTINLNMLNVFDRAVPIERKKACILLKSSFVEGSPNAIHRHTYFRVVDKEKAAGEGIKRIKDGQRALMIAQGLYGEELANYGRNLGIDPTIMSALTLEYEVLKRAKDNPAEFLLVHENPNREILTVLRRALETRVVENDLTVGYKFQGYVFGHNEDLAIKFLKENPDILTSIDVRSKEKVSDTIKIMSKQTTSSVPRSDAEIELELLKKELEKQKEINAQLAAGKIREEISQEVLTPEVAEFKELLKKAESLKMKGLHLYKATPDSMKKLRDKIAEKEAAKKN
jgi:hypothetical protein